MKNFFTKHFDKLDEKDALHLIHCEIHKVLKEYEHGKPYVKDLEIIREMVDDLIRHEHAKISYMASHHGQPHHAPQH